MKNISSVLRINVSLKHTRHFCITSARSDRVPAKHLEKSKLSTDTFQASLPKLPIPKLENTISRYLTSVRAVVDKDEFIKTEVIANAFKEKDGAKLHEQLTKIDKENPHTSFITPFWFEMYLKSRSPLPLNYNPIIGVQPELREDYNDPLIRATNTLVTALQFRNSLMDNILSPDVFHLNPKKTNTPFFEKVMTMVPKSVAFYAAAGLFKAYALDSSQYANLFHSTRIPMPQIDSLYSQPHAQHIVVLVNGSFYKVKVVDEYRNIMLPRDILQSLKEIQQHSQENPLPASQKISSLTGLNRDDWAKLRNSGFDSTSSQEVKVIDSAILCLTLEDGWGDPQNIVDTPGCIKEGLVGDGTSRWFDKCLTLIVSQRGDLACHFEHSWGDGVCVARFLNEIHKHTTLQKPGEGGLFVSCDHLTLPRSAVADWRPLDFSKLPSRTQDAVCQAKDDLLARKDTLDVNMLQCDNLRPSAIDYKKTGLSTDAIMQFIMQLAYRRATGATAVTYESASTACFKHGRTETVRSATTATNTACDLFLDASSSQEQKLAALKAASELHSQLIKEALTGDGFDRHMYALKCVAERNGDPTPEIFSDPAYLRMNQIELSTSTVNQPALAWGGFAPVTPTGLGVGYGISEGNTGFCVSSYKTSHKLANDFNDGLIFASNALQNVLKDFKKE